MNREATIAAVATPPGDGGVAIVRISGSAAMQIAGRLFGKDVGALLSHRATFGKLRSLAGEVVDEVLLLPMRGPHSFTGEDVVEIHCHGGRLITQRVLEAVLEAGAEPAGPGAFSERAYLNGKMDLAQAEAIQQLIHARSEEALKAARDHLSGSLSKKIVHFQKELTEVAAIIEAWVDYPEEGLEFATPEEITTQLDELIDQMQHLCDTFQDGKVITEGLTLCLLGTPNVGKSSLMNALLGKDRAIVTEIAGTTRDLLEEPLRIGSMHYTLVDTAGLRTTSEVIEQEGIRRSRQSAADAEVILCVLDGSRQRTDEEEALLASLPPEKTVIIHNKCDLPAADNAPLAFPHQVKISARTEAGMEMLKNVVCAAFTPQPKPLMLTSARHHRALVDAIAATRAGRNGICSGLSPELLASDLRAALRALATIIGLDVTEEILSAIFSKFCVGK